MSSCFLGLHTTAWTKASSTWPQSTWEERKKTTQWEHMGKGGTFHYCLVKGMMVKSKAMEGHTSLGSTANAAIY